MSESLPLASGAGAAAVVERLAARQQQLQAEREQRQAQLQAESDTREDVSSFLISYKADFQQLQQRYAGIQQQAATSAQQDGAAKAALLEQLEALSVDISSREHNVSAAAYFLPPYELRSCASQLQQLRLQLAETKQQLQPKRKFAFSKAVAKTSISTTAAAAAQQQHQQQGPASAAASTEAAAAPAAAANTAAQSSSAAAAADSADHPPSSQTPAAAAAAAAAAATAEVSTPPPGPSPQDQQLIAAGHGYAGLMNQVLVPSAVQLSGQGFVLHNLTNCDVYLLGKLSALRLQHLRNCRVYTGPVVGATFVDGCRDCTFMLASYQVRIHSAQLCQFYLRVRSRPIIEHSSNLAFAAYAAETLLSQQPATAADGDAAQQQQQQQQQQQWHPAALLSEAQLLDDTGLWQQVDDFGWVKASASPHWKVLPEAERQPVPPQLPQQP